MSDTNIAEYTVITARLAILKAKAAFPCAVHPDSLILNGDPESEERAYTIARNTIKFNDKTDLLENITLAVRQELNAAGKVCKVCSGRNL